MARHYRAHHRVLFNRERISPYCFVQAFTGLLRSFIGSHSRDAPVGTRSGRRQFLWEISASPCNGCHAGASWCVNWFTRPLALVRSLAHSPYSRPIKIRRLEFIRFTLCAMTRASSWRIVCKFRGINSTTRRLSDSRSSPPNYSTEGNAHLVDK